MGVENAGLTPLRRAQLLWQWHYGTADIRTPIRRLSREKAYGLAETTRSSEQVLSGQRCLQASRCETFPLSPRLRPSDEERTWQRSHQWNLIQSQFHRLMLPCIHKHRTSQENRGAGRLGRLILVICPAQ